MNIFTEKKAFENSKIKELFCNITNDINIEYEKGDFHLNIEDTNNQIEIKENTFIKFKMITSIIFLDLMESFLNTKRFSEDYKNIVKKFNYGIIFLDFEKMENMNIIRKFLFNSEMKAKKFISLPCLKPFNLDKNIDNLNVLKDELNIIGQFKNYNLNKFPSYTSEMIKFFNNFEIYQMFDESINIEEYHSIEVKSFSYICENILDKINSKITKEFARISYFQDLNIVNLHWKLFFDELLLNLI